MKMNKVKQRFIAFFKGRNCPAAATALLVAVSVMVLNLIFYTVGSSVPMYLRFTEEPDLSIGSSSDDNFADAVARGDKVTVTFCMYRDVIAAHTTGKYVLDTAEQFAEKYPELITLRFINVLTQLDESGAPVDMTPSSTARATEFLSRDIPLSSSAVISSESSPTSPRA